jgi:hypothetical protein
VILVINKGGLIMEQMREQQKEGWESMPAGKHQEIDNKQ